MRKRESTNERTNIDTKVTFLLLFIASTKFCDFGFKRILRILIFLRFFTMLNFAISQPEALSLAEPLFSL